MNKVNAVRKNQFRTGCCALAIGFSMCWFPAPSFAISVSISDNVVVLDSRRRSGEVELLSMTPSPVEFDVKPASLPEDVKDGRAYLRWSPARTLVPANQGRPLRMVFRPPADLLPGEYIVRLAVKSRQVNYQPIFLDEPEPSNESAGQGLAVGMAIQPVLPVTVYMRHEVDSPALQVSPFEATIEDASSHGHFLVRKKPGAISFVGAVALVGEETGSVLIRGRMRMGQTVDEMRVSVPRRDNEARLKEPVCLHLWPNFPARGEPEQKVCSY